MNQHTSLNLAVESGRRQFIQSAAIGVGVAAIAANTPSLIAGQVLPAADPEFSDAEARRLANQVRRLAVTTLNPDMTKTFDQQTTDVGRGKLFGGVISYSLMGVVVPGAATATPRGPSVWRQLVTGLAGLIPGANMVPIDIVDSLLSARAPSGGMFKFDANAYDRIAQNGAEASVNLISKYLSAEAAATYPSVPPLVRTQHLLDAISNLLKSRGWPTVGLLFFTDLPSVRETILKPALEVDAWPEADLRVWNQAWEQDTNPQHRGLQVQKAIEAILRHGAALLHEPPQMTVQEFMQRSSFKNWRWGGDLEPSHIVCEAFGRTKMQEFEQATEAKRMEHDQLYRASLVQVVAWKLALLLAI